MTCDYHRCAQCLAEPDSQGGFDVVFRASTHRTTRGRRVVFSILGVPNSGDWPPEYAREIAKRLLDAADECEDLDWKERSP